MDMPNVFVTENGELVILEEIYELTPDDKIRISEAISICKETEKIYGEDIDTMFRNEIPFKIIKHYICARHDLIAFGYEPKDWRD